MAEFDTARLALRRWTAASDTPNRVDFDTSFSNIEDRVAGWVAPNTLANRPAAGAAYDRFLFHAHDTDQLFMCVDIDGVGSFAWKELPTDESVVVSSSAPASPDVNDLWLDTTA